MSLHLSICVLGFQIWKYLRINYRSSNSFVLKSLRNMYIYIYNAHLICILNSQSTNLGMNVLI